MFFYIICALCTNANVFARPKALDEKAPTFLWINVPLDQRSVGSLTLKLQTSPGGSPCQTGKREGKTPKGALLVYIFR